MHQINNFLTPEECAELIRLIDNNHARSSVVVGGTDRSDITDYRTSSTSSFDSNNPLIHKIKTRISQMLNLDEAKGEALQGQLYEEGQYFKPHNDFFTGAGYDMHCKASGNRTHTFMIYLNEGFEGGGTNFPKLNRVIEPGQGKALWWHNMENGKVQEQYLHEGMPIIKGKKYIVTSWWREKRWDGAGDETQYEESKSRIVKVEPPLMNASESNIKIYKNKDDVPKVTPKGFDLMKCPEETWNIIKDSYKLLLTHKTEESFEGKKEFIEGQTELLSFDLIPSIRDLIHTQLIEVHKNFSNNNLNPSAVYGIRSYNRGAVLKPHYDRVETHHISSIVIVDKDLACGCSNKPEADDWALDIQGHDGEWYKIYAEPGDMILYESAVCQHGRKEPFGGTFFRNFYVHYQYDH